MANDSKTKLDTRCTTPEFRVSFPTLKTPKAAFENQDPSYSVQMLFPKSSDLTALKKIVGQVIRAKWGEDKTKWPKNLKTPFKDGNEKNLENYKDMTVVEARSKMKPGLVDKKLNEILDASEVYAGCWARATVTVYAYDKAVNKGVAIGLQNVQKLRDDTAFSGKKNAKDDFEMIAGDDDDFANDSSAGNDNDDF